MGTARGKLLAKGLKRQLPRRKEGRKEGRKARESLSVCLQRWDETAARPTDPCVSFVDMREGEGERARDPRTEEFSSKFGMRRKVEVVEKERDRVKSGRHGSQSESLTWTGLDDNGRIG